LCNGNFTVKRLIPLINHVLECRSQVVKRTQFPLFSQFIWEFGADAEQPLTRLSLVAVRIEPIAEAAISQPLVAAEAC
jgi:hypothetical protein